MTTKIPQIILLTPDELTSQHVKRSLAAVNILEVQTLAPSKTFVADATEVSAASQQPILIIVSSTKLRRMQLDLAEHVNSKGGTVLVWSAGALADAKKTDPWILDRLLQQRGALLSTRLAVVIEAARLAIFFGQASPPRIKISGRFGELGLRFKSILKDRGVQISTHKRREQCVLSCKKNGEVQLSLPNGNETILKDLDISSSALSLLASAATNETNINDKSEPYAPDTETIRLIARPPARLLSETTSKKLAAAFGIQSGPERLCQSPTEASRFAGELGVPTVLKLVRPSLEHKSTQNAVALSVENGATVRRVFHKLKSLANDMGPPKPLGVLVAAEITGGTRIWIKTANHDFFGKLLFIGKGDNPTSAANFVLSIPFSRSQAQNALTLIFPQNPHEETASIANMLLNLSNLLNTLGSRIARAEIHPMVAVGNNPAVALDALIAISDVQP